MGEHTNRIPFNVYPVDPMPVVKVSSKYQVVIPREVREAMGIEPGQEVEVLGYGHRIELIPVEPMRAVCGFLSGIDTEVEPARNGVHRSAPRLS